MSSIRTRAGIAPNRPTIDNLGSLRTHIYNYTLAQANQGTFVLRFDDTNPKKHRREWIQGIESQLAQLGICGDYNSLCPINHLSTLQSERSALYEFWSNRMISTGFAYRVDGSKAVKVDVSRYLATYPSVVSWQDLVLGDIQIDLSQLKDYFIFRSDGTALYHFACIIDDHEMEITHHLRGQDKLSSLAYQLIIRNVLGLRIIQYGHLPLLLGEDGRRLSTRKGDPSFSSLKAAGFLDPAILSYVCASGYGDPEAKYNSLEHFAQQFDVCKIHRNSSKLDIRRLTAINHSFIGAMAEIDFVEKAITFLPDMVPSNHHANLRELLLRLKNRFSTFVEVRDLAVMLYSPVYEYLEPAALRSAVERLIESLTETCPSKLELQSLVGNEDKRLVYHALRWILTGRLNGINLEVLLDYFLKTELLWARIESVKQELTKYIPDSGSNEVDNT